MQALQNIDPEHILFLDIETVSNVKEFSQLNSDWQVLWEKKSKTLSKNGELPEDLYERAGIYSEFGRIVCIGLGFLRNFGSGYKLRLKAISGHDEKAILTEFAELLNSRFSGNQFLLCAHNGKEFDFPYIARRMMVHGIKIPIILDSAGKKPWEVQHLDTMELWKFGDFKNFTSLNLLAHLFNIPTPKDDIDGSQVGSVYWQDNNIERIATYCKKDVITLARLLLKFKGNGVIEDADLENA